MSAWGSFDGSGEFEDAQTCLILGVFFVLSRTETGLSAGTMGVGDSWVPVIPFVGSAVLIPAEP